MPCLVPPEVFLCHVPLTPSPEPSVGTGHSCCRPSGWAGFSQLSPWQGRLSVVGKPACCWKSTAVTLCRAERAPCRSHCISGWKRKETFYGNFFNDFPIFFLGKLSAITYSVPEGINYSLVLIVRISYSELLDVMSSLDRVRGHMAFLFPSFFPCSVLSVRLLV